MKAVGYLRVSTDDKDQDPDRQRRYLESYAKSNGIEVVSWVVDEGTSAFKVPPLDRPKVQIAISRAKAADADYILVEDLDRWSRGGPKELAHTEVRLEQLFSLEVMMANTPKGEEGLVYEIVKTVKAYMAHEYSRLLSQRVSQGLALAKKKGFPKGKPGRQPKPDLSADELEEALAMMEDGKGGRAIARRISESRGAFDMADVKRMQTKRVSESWVRRQIVEWCNKNPDVSLRVSTRWPTLLHQNEDESKRGDA